MRLDDWLIDRVFQRISDRLPGGLTCYGAASFAFIGAAFCAGAYVLARPGTIVISGLIAVWMCMRAVEVQREDGRGRDVLPAFRIRDTPLRILFLFGLAFNAAIDVPAIIWHLYPPRLALLDAQNALAALAFYFAACRNRPKARQRVRVPSGAALGSAGA